MTERLPERSVDADPVGHAWHRLHSALASAGIGTWHLDLRTGVVTHDESLNRLLGRAAVETRSTLDARFEPVHPADRARVRAIVHNALARRCDFTTEFRIVRPDGEVRWLRDRGRIVTGDDGTPLLATVAVMDITEQRRLEEHERMLAETVQSFATATDPEAALGVVAADLVPGFAAACGACLRDGDNICLAASAGDTRLAPSERQVTDVVASGAAVTGPEMLVVPLRTGAHTLGAVWFSAGASSFAISDVAFATALADFIALALDRARLARELERAKRVKEEFLATLSHELRTPLDAVLGWTRTLRRGVVPSDRTAAILETIERNAAAQMQLVEELLDLSSMAAGGLRLTITRVDMRDVVASAIETVRAAAEAKSLRLDVMVSHEIDEIAGDPARLRQAIWNLLANAVKFTPAGGTINVRVTQGPGDIEFVVRDSGAGIDAERLPHVFRAFRQGDAAASRRPGGLGLGLAIVHYIVEAHGGTVDVQSDGAGCGSQFAVRLPTGRLSRQPGARSATARLRGRRVLAVDDDESTQELVATMLLMYGVSVRTAGRSSDAMAILSEWRPDVLLADIAMPGEDGYALMRRVRGLPPPAGTIPAVALTAFTDAGSVQKAFDAGFDAHLGKPLEPHVLADALSKVLLMKK